MEENKNIEERPQTTDDGQRAQEIISPEEIPVTETEEPQTTNNKLPTENDKPKTEQMEVHHHSHERFYDTQ